LSWTVDIELWLPHCGRCERGYLGMAKCEDWRHPARGQGLKPGIYIRRLSGPAEAVPLIAKLYLVDFPLLPSAPGTRL